MSQDMRHLHGGVSQVLLMRAGAPVRADQSPPPKCQARNHAEPSAVRTPSELPGDATRQAAWRGTEKSWAAWASTGLSCKWRKSTEVFPELSAILPKRMH